jgi:hypothetical protein
MSKPPIKKLRDGLLVVTIWKQEKDGKTWYTVEIHRSYKPDENSDWKETNSYSVSEALRMASLLQQAHIEIVALTNKDKESAKASQSHGEAA